MSTGSLTGALPQHLQQVKGSGGWWQRFGNNPATKPGASIEDSILYEQRIYINHPLVLFNEYLNGQPVCHKCGSKHAPLQSNGWRQSMHPVLDRDCQFYVISFGLICPSCPAHEGKNFNFSTNEAAFLQRNFSPAIFNWLPWEILTEKSGITKDLARDIRFWRTKGASFQQIAGYRNEAVANRILRVLTLHLQHQLMKRERRAAAESIFAGAAKQSAGSSRQSTPG